MPPMPLRLTSPVRMLSRITVCRRSSSRSRDPPSIPADNFIHRALGLLDGDLVPAITARRKPFTASGFAAAKRRLAMNRDAVGLAAIVGVAKHREVVGRNAAIPQVDRRQIGKPVTAST